MSRRFFYFYRLQAFLILFLCSLTLSGCLAATRLPTESRGAEGATIEKPDLDLSFVQIGTTRREEVLTNLGSIDTGYSDPRLFWGRWVSSSWGFIVRLDVKQVWRTHNLLITFDENGVVQGQEFINNNRVLWRELHAHVAKSPPLDLSQPIQLVISGSYGRSIRLSEVRSVTLANDAMEFARDKAKKPVSISPLQVSRLSYLGMIVDPDHPSATCHVLHLSKKTSMGRRILFCAEPTDLMKMFTYLQQAGPPGMEWE